MPNNIIGERSTAPQNIVGILRNVGSGRGIASIDLDSGCHLVVTYTDGTTWTSDETLRGITSATVTDEYKLKLTYEDGTTWESTQSIRGPVGPSTDTKVGELEDLTTVEKGTAVGAINELDAKAKRPADSALQLLSKKTTEDTDPYLFRRNAGGLSDRADDTIIGGTVAWNQLVWPVDTWHASNMADSSISDGIMSGTATAQYGQFASTISHEVAFITGHKYLAAVWGKTDSETTYTVYYSTNNGFSKRCDLVNTWEYFTVIYNHTGANSNKLPVVYDAKTSGWQKIYIKSPMAFDLTQLFGTEIADYIYSLEQATPGAGVQWFKQYFPKDYYPYNAGELISVKPTAKVTADFNQWNGVGYSAKYWNDSGVLVSYAGNSCTDKILVYPGESYYVSNPNVNCVVKLFDSNMVLIDKKDFTTAVLNRVVTIPNNGLYLCINFNSPNLLNICVNLSDPNKNGTYEPYVGRTYPLGAEVRGLINLVDGKLVFNNGDIYTPDGKIKRKYGIVDLGALNWGYSSADQRFYNNTVSYKYPTSGSVPANAISGKYPIVVFGSLADKTMTLYSNGYIYVKDSSYTDATTFKNSLSGIYLVYELATPTTEQSLPYDSPQVIFPEGTEQYVDDRTVPLIVGHITTYHTDMRNKLESLPDSTLEHWEVGSADQLTTKLGDTDQVPYLYRKSGEDLTVGTREYDTLVGGTVAENQLANNAGVPSARNGITFTASQDGMSYIVNGTTTAAGSASGWFNLSETSGFANTENHYILIMTRILSGSITGEYRYYILNQPIMLWGTSTIQKCATSNNQRRFVISWAEGVVFDNANVSFNAIDLTQMLGTTIADYVYSLETATAGAGVSWLKKYGFIDDNYHPYNAGSLVSVHPSKHKMVGFNQWDEEWEVGGIDNTTGQNVTNPNLVRSKNYIQISASNDYYLNFWYSVASSSIMLYFYDASKNYLGRKEKWNNKLLSSEFPIGTSYMRWRSGIYATTCGETCINISDPSRNGEYEPYNAHEYALPDSDLRGIFKLDSNNIPYCDGDTDDGNGTRTRKYGIVTLDENSIWGMDTTTSFRYFDCSSVSAVDAIAWETNVFTNYEYSTQPTYPYCQINASRKIRVVYSINDTSVTTVEQLKAKLAAHNLQVMYPLATPVTEESTPFQNPQIVDPYGTEEYIDTRDVTVPVGHSTRYPKDLKRKLEELPDPPSGANGTYILKATINNGVTTYSWVVE